MKKDGNDGNVEYMKWNNFHSGHQETTILLDVNDTGNYI